MKSRPGVAIVILALALALPLPLASGQISIRKSDSNQQVDTVTRGKCRVSGKKGNRDFFLTAKSDHRKFRLSVFLDSPVFTGFGKFYTAFYGGTDPQIFLRRLADDKTYSNFKLPGTPAGTVFAGGVAFQNKGRRVGVGLYGATDKGGTEGYTFAGPINCRYSRR